MTTEDCLLPSELDIADSVRVSVASADRDNADKSVAAANCVQGCDFWLLDPVSCRLSQGDMTMAVRAMLDVLESLHENVVTRTYPPAPVIAHVRAAADILDVR
jgi:hypothetical protein